MKQFKSLPELLTYFHDEQVCRDYLVQQRWNGKPVCPHCQNSEKKIYIIEDGKRYKCSDCKKKFSVTVGTVFEHIRIPLHKAFAAIYIATAHKKGISSCQLARDLGITQKSAWFTLHKIREMLNVKNPAMLTGSVQADETFVGGKNKNRHSDKKVLESQGRSVKDKTPVFGMVHEGNVNTIVVPDTKASTLKPIIKAMVEEGAIVVTDEWGGYNKISAKFDHYRVSHSTGLYVIGEAHTNGIENFWSMLKRGIVGQYHNISEKHMDKYINEFCYRYNNRENKEIFNQTMLKAVNL